MGSKNTVLATSDLNDQQRTFVMEYIASSDFNATEAARKAGYKNPSVSAARLLNNPKVKRFLKQKQTRREQKLELRAERVLFELQCIGFRNMKDFVDPDNGGLITDIRKLPNHAAAVIKKLKEKHDTYYDGENTHDVVTFELEFESKIPALDMLMRHMGIDKPQPDVKNEEADETKKKLVWDEYYDARGDNDIVNVEIDKIKALGGPTTPELITNPEQVRHGEENT